MYVLPRAENDVKFTSNGRIDSKAYRTKLNPCKKSSSATTILSAAQ